MRALIKIVTLFLSQIIKVLVGNRYLFKIEANIFCNTCNTGWLLITTTTFLEYKCHSFQTWHIKDYYKNDCSRGKGACTSIYGEEQSSFARLRVLKSFISHLVMHAKIKIYYYLSDFCRLFPWNFRK